MGVRWLSKNHGDSSDHRFGRLWRKISSNFENFVTFTLLAQIKLRKEINTKSQSDPLHYFSLFALLFTWTLRSNDVKSFWRFFALNFCLSNLKKRISINWTHLSNDFISLEGKFDFLRGMTLKLEMRKLRVTRNWF